MKSFQDMYLALLAKETNKEKVKAELKDLREAAALRSKIDFTP